MTKRITIEIEVEEDGRISQRFNVQGLNLFETMGLLRYYHRKLETDAIINHSRKEVAARKAAKLTKQPKKKV